MILQLEWRVFCQTCVRFLCYLSPLLDVCGLRFTVIDLRKDPSGWLSANDDFAVLRIFFVSDAIFVDSRVISIRNPVSTKSLIWLRKGTVVREHDCNVDTSSTRMSVSLCSSFRNFSFDDMILSSRFMTSAQDGTSRVWRVKESSVRISYRVDDATVVYELFWSIRLRHRE